MEWHRIYRSNNEAFPNRHLAGRISKPPLPRLLEENPDFKMSLLKHAKENLSTLSAESLYAYLHNVALPVLLEERKTELGDDGGAYGMAGLL